MKRSIVFITPVFILLLLSLGILLSGCKGTTPEEIGNRYLSLWKEGHYQEAYALLSQKSMDTISQDDFVAKYQNIYKGIGLNSISYTVEKTVK